MTLLLLIAAYLISCSISTQCHGVAATNHDSENNTGIIILFHPNCSLNHIPNCQTLSGWINNDSSSFVNDTAVILLPGVHLIDSTKHTLQIKDVHSISLCGHPRETLSATISCIHNFRIDFINVVNISISNIVVQSCAVLSEFKKNILNSTLLFVQAKNITIVNTIIVNGGITIIESKRGSVFHLINSKILSTLTRLFFYYDSVKHYSNVGCTVTDKVLIYDSNTSVHASGNAPIEYCIEFYIYNVTVEHNTEIAFSMNTVHKVVFTNITVHNNSGHSSILYVRSSITEFKGLNVFSHNNKAGSGVDIGHGSLKIHPSGSIKFLNNKLNAGTLFYVEIRRQMIVGRSDGGKVTMIFTNNEVQLGGIFVLETYVVYTPESVVNITNAEINLENNTSTYVSDNYYPVIMMLKNLRRIEFKDCNTSFVNNSSPLSGALTIANSEVKVSKFIANFEYNIGSDGGAIALYEHSFFYCSDFCQLKLYHNKASKLGGAIFVEDTDYINSYTRVIVGLPFQKPSFLPTDEKIILDFVNNSAELAGNDVYGGWIDASDYVTVTGNHLHDDLSAIASNPTRICMCENFYPKCSEIKLEMGLFPGESFKIEAVAVGQRMGVVPSIVIAEFGDNEGNLGEGQNVQRVGKLCTSLQFTVYSAKETKTLNIRAQDIGTPNLDTSLKYFLYYKYHILFEQLSVTILLKKCPLGFYFSTLLQCECFQSIEDHIGVSCDLQTYRVKRSKNKWLSAVFEHNDTQEHGVIIHDHCPYDYCQSKEDSLAFHLESQDDQCAFNRSGVLCGECKMNFSQVLGSSRCRRCPMYMVIVVFLGGILAGLLLVIFLMTLNLTVSIGTINGFLFYANVIKASQTALFPPEMNGSFLNTFIAWLNLDVGIEMCFYDGLDAYTKTWLQFVFPLYMWLIVIIIVISSHYSTKASKLFGNNALQVLATLFLLRYSELSSLCFHLQFLSTLMVIMRKFGFTMAI